MIQINPTIAGITLSFGGISVPIKSRMSSPDRLEDDMRKVFEAAHIDHSVRDLAVLKYAQPTKLYLELDRALLTISTECDTDVEVQGSKVMLSKLLTAAGIPHES